MALLTTLSALFLGSSRLPGQSASVPKSVGKARQMMVITTLDWDSIDGTLQRYQRKGRSWQKVGEAIPIVVGKSGLGWGRGLVEPQEASGPAKKEGDGKSPAGIFALGTSFGYAPQKLEGSSLPYLSLTPSIECVDDVSSQHYNRIVDRSTVTPDWSSSEHMRDTGESYRWGIVVDHNGIASQKTSAGGGSCIFLHVWKGPSHGTAGCTAMAQPQIEELLRWLNPDKNPILVQLPAEQYALFQKAWRLPAR